MSNIKYSDCSVGYQYDAGGKQLSNWNPDLDYGNEYVKVFFRIETVGYGYPSFCFSEEDRDAFDQEVDAVFSSLGWECENQAMRGSCATYRHGKSHLYLHPQNFSGEVLKNEIRTVAEALTGHKSFKLRWVDLYNTVYDVSDEIYEKMLAEKVSQIRDEILQTCKTKRTTLFFNINDVLYTLTKRFSIPRVGIDERTWGEIGQTGRYILSVIEDLANEGYLIMIKQPSRTLLRTINRTEQKQRKLFVA